MPNQYSPSRTIEERFWEKVAKSNDPNGCWEWTGARNTRLPYGFFKLRTGKQMYAHRIAYQLSVCPIPEGLCVLHRCDNPSCVRPDHLFLGTHADNSRDMVAKKRAAVGDRHGSQRHPERVPRGDRNGLRKHPERVPRGERNGNTHLTRPNVEEIRRRYDAGDTTLQALADEFGVGRSTIHRIVNHVVWNDYHK